MTRLTRRTILAAVPSAIALGAVPALAQKKYDTGASDGEIKIGHTNPYSGPASAYGVIGKTETAFFTMINDQGGVNGRKINFISYDDAYSPPKTVEQVRKLVESDRVLLLFNLLGTPTNSAIHKYVNQRKVPHLFIASGATKWGDPKNFPWSMGWQPNYQSEGHIYGNVIVDKPSRYLLGGGPCCCMIAGRDFVSSSRMLFSWPPTNHQISPAKIGIKITTAKPKPFARMNASRSNETF
jgi:branched-chain amino acid transport system substrate-binding protein